MILRDVYAGYGDKLILKAFNLSLPDRGIVCLMGPSGCGKTTLLRVMAGLEQIFAGSVERDPNARLSMVFQENRLIGQISALDNVKIVLGPERQCLAIQYLEACGLGESAELYPEQLSGGMKRRLAIARAVAFCGDILLLDEPFQGLDVSTRSQIADFLFRRKQVDFPLPALTLLVTHDVHEAVSVADRILVLDGPVLSVRADLVVGTRNGVREPIAEEAVLCVLQSAQREENL